MMTENRSHEDAYGDDFAQDSREEQAPEVVGAHEAGVLQDDVLAKLKSSQEVGELPPLPPKPDEPAKEGTGAVRRVIESSSNRTKAGGKPVDIPQRKTTVTQSRGHELENLKSDVVRLQRKLTRARVYLLLLVIAFFAVILRDSGAFTASFSGKERHVPARVPDAGGPSLNEKSGEDSVSESSYHERVMDVAPIDSTMDSNFDAEDEAFPLLEMPAPDTFETEGTPSTSDLRGNAARLTKETSKIYDVLEFGEGDEFSDFDRSYRPLYYLPEPHLATPKLQTLDKSTMNNRP